MGIGWVHVLFGREGRVQVGCETLERKNDQEYMKHENLNLKGVTCLCPGFFSQKVKPAQQPAQYWHRLIPVLQLALGTCVVIDAGRLVWSTRPTLSSHVYASHSSLQAACLLP